MSKGHDAEDLVKGLDEEIALAEGTARDTPTEPEVDDTPVAEAPVEEPVEEAVVDEPEEEVVAEEVALDADDEVEKEVPQKKKRVNWKREFETIDNRFNRYKGSTDQTIHQLRMEVTNLKEALVNAERINRELGADTNKTDSMPTLDLTSVLSEGEQEYLGEEGIDAVKKIVTAYLGNIDDKTKQLEDNLRIRDEKNVEQEIHNERIDQFNRFCDGLESHVPGYKKYIEDPKFQEWCATTTDPYNGDTVRNNWIRAERNGDLRTAVSYLQHYIKQNKTTQTRLDENLTPKGNVGGGSVTPKVGPSEDTKPMLSLKKVTEFYDGVANGDYEGRADEVKELEAQIEEAQMEGRIIDDMPKGIR